MKQKQKTERRYGFSFILGAVLCLILLPVLAINLTLITGNLVHPDAVPSCFGVTPMVVLTDSMYPTIESGDLILCKKAEPAEIKAGDILSFFDPDGNGKSVVTHRVIEIVDGDDGPAFITKGDANNVADRSMVPAALLVGRYEKRIPGLGKAVLFTQTPTGLLLCILLPVTVFILVDLLRRKKEEKHQTEDKEALLRELEELRAKQTPHS